MIVTSHYSHYSAIAIQRMGFSYILRQDCNWISLRLIWIDGIQAIDCKQFAIKPVNEFEI